MLSPPNPKSTFGLNFISYSAVWCCWCLCVMRLPSAVAIAAAVNDYADSCCLAFISPPVFLCEHVLCLRATTVIHTDIQWYSPRVNVCHWCKCRHARRIAFLRTNWIHNPMKFSTLAENFSLITLLNIIIQIQPRLVRCTFHSIYTNVWERRRWQCRATNAYTIISLHSRSKSVGWLEGARARAGWAPNAPYSVAGISKWANISHDWLCTNIVYSFVVCNIDSMKCTVHTPEMNERTAVKRVLAAFRNCLTAFFQYFIFSLGALWLFDVSSMR